MAILHRKNSLSYKTLNGARTGDLFMSLIHTCRLNGVNPFDYLLAIATHARGRQTGPEGLAAVELSEVTRQRGQQLRHAPRPHAAWPGGRELLRSGLPSHSSADRVRGGSF